VLIRPRFFSGGFLPYIRYVDRDKPSAWPRDRFGRTVDMFRVSVTDAAIALYLLHERADAVPAQAELSPWRSSIVCAALLSAGVCATRRTGASH